MTGSATIGVLALQGDFREHVRVLESLGVRASGVRRSSDLDAVDALVIPGGESTTMGKLAVAFDLLDPLRKRVAAGMPAYGSCAGLILLADRLVDAPPGQVTIGGLDVAVRRNAFGRQVDSFEEDLEFASIGPEPMHAVFIRAPWVEEVGPEVEVLAQVAGKVVAVRQGSLLATSFHPELTGDTRVHRLFVEIVKGSA